jgi:uncharacterized membrane protein
MSIDPDVLREVPMFKLFDEDEVRELWTHIQEREFVGGQTIFKVGDAGGEMFVVLEGRVETFILDSDGHRVVLADLEPGEMFGELSLLDDEPRSASAIAVTKTRVCCIDREDLRQLFAKKPHAAFDILAMMSRRLRAADQMLAERMARNSNTVIEEKLTIGDRIADGVARFGGSWMFINTFTVIMLCWMLLNTWPFLTGKVFDPPPFIGLNLVLSMLAALQAPVIMMSQNRQDSKDRVRADVEYEVNLRAETEIMELHHKVDKMKEELVDLLVSIKNK